NQDIDSGKQQVLDVESAQQMIERAETLAVTKCTCRMIAHKCDSPLEVCLQMDNAAKYTLDRCTGREVNRRQAKDILLQAEEAGLVHVTMNRAHSGHFICNCCSCCCQALPLVISEGLNICDPSRFQARIDPESCTGCETCVERCQFDAIAAPETDESVMAVLEEKCMGCGLCQVTCPEEAISLVEVRPQDFIPS
ncbi:MAG: ATP-binding protein, partial [Thermodesulfobacteriota bacterium]